MKATGQHIKIICTNRKARHDYFIVDEMEAGIVLVGTEVKSLRMGKANLKDSYARIKKGEIFVHQLHIGVYSHAFFDNHDPLRVRKLLLHKREIKRLIGKIQNKGITLVPTALYFSKGKAKIRIAMAKGKRKYDKREAIKKRDQKRDMERERNNY